jgi:hypothetical protein
LIYASNCPHAQSSPLPAVSTMPALFVIDSDRPGRASPGSHTFGGSLPGRSQLRIRL